MTLSLISTDAQPMWVQRSWTQMAATLAKQRTYGVLVSCFIPCSLDAILSMTLSLVPSSARSVVGSLTFQKLYPLRQNASYVAYCVGSHQKGWLHRKFWTIPGFLQILMYRIQDMVLRKYQISWCLMSTWKKTWTHSLTEHKDWCSEGTQPGDGHMKEPFLTVLSNVLHQPSLVAKDTQRSSDWEGTSTRS